MGDYEHKTNRGSMFRNEKKEKESQPDERGTINIEGRLFWISSWWEKTRDGREYQSISVAPIEEGKRRERPRSGPESRGNQSRARSQHREERRRERPPRNDYNPPPADGDDIPF